MPSIAPRLAEIILETKREVVTDVTREHHSVWDLLDSIVRLTLEHELEVERLEHELASVRMAARRASDRVQELEEELQGLRTSLAAGDTCDRDDLNARVDRLPRITVVGEVVSAGPWPTRHRER